MKLIVFFTALFSFTTHAEDRIVKCAALDSLNTEYSFEMNIDSGAIKVMPADGLWKTLYSETKKCGLNVGKVVCSQAISHNLDKPNQPHFAVALAVTCKSKGGLILKELSGSAEINRFGDGYGSFVCGALSTNELQLSNCAVY